MNYYEPQHTRPPKKGVSVAMIYGLVALLGAVATTLMISSLEAGILLKFLGITIALGFIGVIRAVEDR